MSRSWNRLIVAACLGGMLAGCQDVNDAFDPAAAKKRQQEQLAQGDDGSEGGEKVPIAGRTTYEVFDMKKEMAENPKLVIVSYKGEGQSQDYVSAVARGYHKATSEISAMNFQHQMDIYKESMFNGKYPTYDQFQKMQKRPDMALNLAVLKPYQKWGYNEDNGSVVILEDPDKKAALLEKSTQ